jgi:hypothetical protein
VGEIAAHLYVPHGRGGVVHGAPLHGLSPRAMRAPAERIGIAVHVHVRRHAGRRACQCDERGKNNKLIKEQDTSDAVTVTVGCED